MHGKLSGDRDFVPSGYQPSVLVPSRFRPLLEGRRPVGAARLPDAGAHARRLFDVKSIERLFESILWNSRFLTLVAVIVLILGEPRGA